jgi:hypothetical protein
MYVRTYVRTYVRICMYVFMYVCTYDRHAFIQRAVHVNGIECDSALFQQKGVETPSGSSAPTPVTKNNIA